MPITAFDGGVYSAETHGRGGTMASNMGTAASGSENPAALGFVGSQSYTTVLVDTDSDLTDDLTRSEDPLSEKVLQYIALSAEKGVIFFEPIGRLEERQILNTNSPSTDYRDVEFSANSFGFAGASRLGRYGKLGIGISYLRASLAENTLRTGQPPTSNLDTADGVRLNIGALFRTGPGTWGFTLQNAPGFLWWKDHKRQILPFRIRAGNTWTVKERVLFSADVETRYYDEGSQKETFVYLGQELFVRKEVVLRYGVFSENLNRPEKRHWTGGISIHLTTGAKISYAFERFEINEKNVDRSYVTVAIPLLSQAN